MDQVRTRIGGHRVAADRWLPTVNPYGGAELARVPACSEEHVDLACAAAAEALSRDDFPLGRRAEVLDEAARLLADRAEEYARTITLESAKPIAEARQETRRTVDALRLAAAHARLPDAEPVPVVTRSARLAFAVREPVGVVGVITPFVLPLEVVARRLGAAIGAGCPVVLKPSTQTPLTAIRFVDLLVEAGLPVDWVSVVTGPGAEVGAALAAHAVPRLLSFTGSPAVGQAVSGAAGGKRVALALGSNAPVIVERDADLARVVELVVRDGFAFAGQRSNAPQRVIAHEDMLDELVDRLVEAAATLVTGDPMAESTDLGPLIDQCAADRTTARIAEAVAGGGHVAGGGSGADGLLCPAVVVNPPLTGSLWRDEVLGPVVNVVGYRDFDQAVAIANDAAIRQQVGLFTHDVQLVVRAARELDFGGVLVNETPPLDVAARDHRDLTELRYVLLSA